MGKYEPKPSFELRQSEVTESIIYESRPILVKDLYSFVVRHSLNESAQERLARWSMDNLDEFAVFRENGKTVILEQVSYLREFLPGGVFSTRSEAQNAASRMSPNPKYVPQSDEDWAYYREFWQSHYDDTVEFMRTNPEILDEWKAKYPGASTELDELIEQGIILPMPHSFWMPSGEPTQ
jgi:hypothetical protein